MRAGHGDPAGEAALRWPFWRRLSLACSVTTWTAARGSARRGVARRADDGRARGRRERGGLREGGRAGGWGGEAAVVARFRPRGSRQRRPNGGDGTQPARTPATPPRGPSAAPEPVAGAGVAARMPSVSLPPKENALFKRILVSGGRPRLCRGGLWITGVGRRGCGSGPYPSLSLSSSPRVEGSGDPAPSRGPGAMGPPPSPRPLRRSDRRLLPAEARPGCRAPVTRVLSRPGAAFAGVGECQRQMCFPPHARTSARPWAEPCPDARGCPIPQRWPRRSTSTAPRKYHHVHSSARWLELLCRTLLSCFSCFVLYNSRFCCK